MYPIPSKYYWSGWRQVSTYIRILYLGPNRLHWSASRQGKV